MSVSVESIEFRVIPDESPDPSYLEQEGLGFEDRLAAYRNGEFYFVGVSAVATLWVPAGDFKIRQEIGSAGLWGIESDSGDEYLAEIAAGQLDELCDILEALGVDGRSVVPGELTYV